MKNQSLIVIIMLVAFAVVSTGCVAGPWTATESLDDWSAGVYADNTYVGTLVYVLDAFILRGLTGLVDVVVMNNWAFWGYDVWDGTGTTFKHTNAPMGKGNEPGHEMLENPLF